MMHIDEPGMRWHQTVAMSMDQRAGGAITTRTL